MGIEIGFGIGTVIVLGALVYGVSQHNRRDPANEKKTEEATRRLYAEADR